MHKEDFQKCNADHCCYIKRYQSSYIILLLYVDDMLVAGSNMDDIRRLKEQLSKEFDMKDLGQAKKILGMQITRDKHKVQGYVDADFGGEVDRCKSTTGYIFTVGNTTVSWMLQLQKIVALSTTEAEYVAVTEASKEMIWLQGWDSSKRIMYCTVTVKVQYTWQRI
uniref:Reverse transcriptase Ty1/copia-type domain-containing protein n=1 Tax=Chenopodium quinoa TaxID=63459 RepID=A0A803KNZ2_CHEQI